MDAVIEAGCKELIVYADSSGKPKEKEYLPGKLGCCQHVELCYLSEKIGINPEAVLNGETGEKVTFSGSSVDYVSERRIVGTKDSMLIIWRDLGLGSKPDFLKAGGAIVY